MELKTGIWNFLDYAGRGGIMLTAAGRPMSVIETNDVIMAYEKHVAHNQKVLEREEAIEKALENIEVTEKGADSRPLYHVIESKEY